jgi:hypothetical protein
MTVRQAALLFRVSVSSIYKALLRQDPARSIDALWRRLGALRDTFTPAECDNVFHHASYQHSI